jgi:hypothetical protein
MKKIIRITESELISLVKEIIKEESQSANKFKAEGVVDGNKRMSFPVTEMSYVDGDVNMNMIDPISKEKLYVVNFRGPIYNAKNTVTKYRNVNFTNINIKNYSQIAKQFGIPFMTT